jgi:hypothetical protein
VEGAGEPVPGRADALDDPDAAVPAGVLESTHAQVGGAQDDDGLVEDLVLDEVTGLGISSSRQAICQTRGQSCSASIW